MATRTLGRVDTQHEKVGLRSGYVVYFGHPLLPANVGGRRRFWR